MKVYIRNNQNEFDVTADLKNHIILAANAANRQLEQSDNAEVSVLLTDNAEIRTLNKTYRNMDKPTDVLSFPLLEFDENRNIIDDVADGSGTSELGDIVLSLPTAQKQADELGHSFLREVCFLVAHSMLHLYGYDHMTETDEIEMIELQKIIMEKIGGTL